MPGVRDGCGQLSTSELDLQTQPRPSRLTPVLLVSVVCWPLGWALTLLTSLLYLVGRPSHGVADRGTDDL
jgi:hypothetical protein